MQIILIKLTYTKSKITINYKKDEFGLRGRKNKIDDIKF